MMTILLYGFLGKRFGRVHRYAVRTPAEAVRALAATLPGFRQALIDGGHYKVLRGGREALTLEQTGEPQSERESLRIVPVVVGAGSIGRIIVGAALIFAAPYATAFLGVTGMASAGVATMIGSAVSSIGWSLVTSGVSQMLFSPPTQRAGEAAVAANNAPSYSFNGAVNTAAQGNPVPVCYGRLIVGSQVISAGLAVEQL
jgi:predicted phage tail protein